jgi:hypothetical protein
MDKPGKRDRCPSAADWGRKHWLLRVLGLGFAVGLVSCSNSPPSTQATPAQPGPQPAAPTPTAAKPTNAQTPPNANPKANSKPSPKPNPKASPKASPKPSPKPNPKASPKAQPLTTIFLYKIDKQCLAVNPQKVMLPARDSLNGAIARILQDWDNADFDLAGYRVNTVNGTATVDFRLLPGSQRQLTSLSSCEQLSLLGSIRQTLLANGQWQIQAVRFTQQGQAVGL